jgi:Predicted branched-chain amino acid permease (azaleucine resistance)
MKLEYGITNRLKEGFISAIPIVIGYMPVAMAFGLLAKTVDISLKDTSLFSIMVFAGASQFMALDLIKAGVTTGSIILATFLLNLRHMMMSASLSVKIKDTKRKWLPFIAFGITDETFSVSSLKNGKLNAPYMLALNTASYASWVCGTIIGYLVGSILPSAVQNSLGIGLYAMFAAILVPEIKKSSNVLYLSIISAALYYLLDHFKVLPSGWNLITAIIAASTLGVVFLKDELEEGKP